MSLSILLILCAVVIVGCLVFHKLSFYIGVPYLLGFIILGMLFGSDGVLRIQFENFKVAYVVCTVALIFIMFYGGFETNLKQAKTTLFSAISLSTVGVLLTALLLTGFLTIFLRISLIESFLIAAVLSSTDAASVFSVLKSKQLNLKYHTASLLEVESGSNDPFAYLLATVGIVIFKGTFEWSSISFLLVWQIVCAVLISVALIVMTALFFKYVSFDNSGILVSFIMAVALLAYALPEYAGGNGYLCTYLVGLGVGNRYLPNKQDVMAFFEGIVNICQMITFFLLGLLSFPKILSGFLFEAIIISLILMLVVRPIVVFGIGYFQKLKMNQMIVITWAGLRGASSIVFAIMVINEVRLSIDIFHVVLFVVILSIIFQGSLLPWVSQKFNMIDNSQNVLKTFNFYSEEVPLNLMRISIPKQHNWVNMKISEIDFPPSTLIFQLERDNSIIVPDGQTVIQENDVLDCVILTKLDKPTLKFYQVKVNSDSDYVGRALEEGIMSKGLIVAIERDGCMLVPDGQTVIQLNDVLLIQRQK